MDCGTPGFPVHCNSWSLQKFMSIRSVMPLSHLIFCCPFLPSFNLSQHQGLFPWVSSSHQVAKVLEFQLQQRWCAKNCNFKRALCTERQSDRTLCDAGNGLYLCCPVGRPWSWSNVLFLFFGCTGSLLWRLGLAGPWHVGLFLDQGWSLCPLHWQVDS